MKTGAAACLDPSALGEPTFLLDVVCALVWRYPHFPACTVTTLHSTFILTRNAYCTYHWQA